MLLKLIKLLLSVWQMKSFKLKRKTHNVTVLERKMKLKKLLKVTDEQ